MNDDRRPDFGALLDAFLWAIRSGSGYEAERAAVVAEYERVWDKRVKAMLERATLSVENKRLTAELAAERQRADGLKAELEQVENQRDRLLLVIHSIPIKQIAATIAALEPPG